MASVVEFVVHQGKRDPNAVFAGSVPYLKLAGLVRAGWQMARAALIAHGKRAADPSFYGTKILTAQFFAEHMLPHAAALATSIVTAKQGEGLLALDIDQF